MLYTGMDVYRFIVYIYFRLICREYLLRLYCCECTCCIINMCIVSQFHKCISQMHTKSSMQNINFKYKNTHNVLKVWTTAMTCKYDVVMGADYWCVLTRLSLLSAAACVCVSPYCSQHP
jgi:hypothetical protein